MHGRIHSSMHSHHLLTSWAFHDKEETRALWPVMARTCFPAPTSHSCTSAECVPTDSVLLATRRLRQYWYFFFFWVRVERVKWEPLSHCTSDQCVPTYRRVAS